MSSFAHVLGNQGANNHLLRPQGCVWNSEGGANRSCGARPSYAPSRRTTGSRKCKYRMPRRTCHNCHGSRRGLLGRGMHETRCIRLSYQTDNTGTAFHNGYKSSRASSSSAGKRYAAKSSLFSRLETTTPLRTHHNRMRSNESGIEIRRSRGTIDVSGPDSGRNRNGERAFGPGNT